MRGKTQSAPKGMRMRALASLGGALLAGFALTGCSAANITGFDFPAFGLVNKSDDETREARAEDIPPTAEELGAQ